MIILSIVPAKHSSWLQREANFRSLLGTVAMIITDFLEAAADVEEDFNKDGGCTPLLVITFDLTMA